MPVCAQTTSAYVERGRNGDVGSWRSPEFLKNRGLAAIGADYAYARGLDAGNLRLGVLDSGVALAHGEFVGKQNLGLISADMLVNGQACSDYATLNGARACFVANGGQALIELDGGIFSYDAHATHVAGIMAANRNGNGMHGVAFGAAIISGRIESNVDVRRGFQLQAKDATVERLLTQMAVQGVRVVNLSFGIDTLASSAAQLDSIYRWQPAIKNGLIPFANAAVHHGMLQVWAAGNEFGRYASIEPSLPRWQPELEAYWLSVVNLNQNGVIDASSSICGASRDWCVAAPGTGIYSSIVSGDIEGELTRNDSGRVNGFSVIEQRPLYGYANDTGTSMAAPNVSGALGLLMQRFPYLDNRQIRDVLLTTATDLGAAGVDDIYGWGLINLRKAIDGPGQMRVDTEVVMERRAGGVKLWQGPAWDDWRNDISGPGRLSKAGPGWLRLSGNNSFAGISLQQGVLELDGNHALRGEVRVNGGLLLLNGVLRNSALTISGGQAVIHGSVDGAVTTVLADGLLSGTGTLADTVVAGRIRPVSRAESRTLTDAGALGVNGDYTQAPGSAYEFVVLPRGRNDHLQISGRASLQGGTVHVLSEALPTLGQRYTVLRANNGVSGGFVGADTPALSPFLKWHLGYDSHQVYLDTLRGIPLRAAAQTPNQRAVSDAIDAMADQQPLLQSLTQYVPQQLRNALDRLSGDGIASISSVLLDASHPMRDAALRHARMGIDGVRHADGDAGGDAERTTGTPATAWAQVLSSRGVLQSDANAASVSYAGNSLLLGMDYQCADGVRLGITGGAGRSTLHHAADKTVVDGRQIGLWIAQHWDGFGLRAGLGYAHHDLDMQRSISTPGLQQQLAARSQARSHQFFVEGAHRWHNAGWRWEPYVQVARLSLRTDAFAERGGIAALNGQVRASTMLLTTLGMRFDLPLQRHENHRLALHGGVGRRQASGALTPSARMAFNNSSSFDITGAPVTRTAVLLEASVTAQVATHGVLEFNYTGTVAHKNSEHGWSGRYSFPF